MLMNKFEFCLKVVVLLVGQGLIEWCFIAPEGKHVVVTVFEAQGK